MRWLCALLAVGLFAACGASSSVGGLASGDRRAQDAGPRPLGPTAPPPPSSAEPDGGAGARAEPGRDAAPDAADAAPPPLADADAAAPQVGRLLPHRAALATFYRALRELEQGKRQDHVRLAWLGDSHAQADFWTGELRRGLAERFGHGGPGFVHLGYRDYRHDGVRVSVHGSWRQRPKPPWKTERWSDGAFGLGGILTAGYADRPSALIELTDRALDGRRMRWDLCYKLGAPEDQFKLDFADQPRQIIRASGRPGQLRHRMVESTGRARLKVTPSGGRPEFCGLVIETVPDGRPGVVLDTLGINGARLGTALAWDPARWGAELRRRNPELVVIEYGGNEGSDWTPRPASYKRQLVQLVRRVRLIAPGVSCLVVGPTDRVDAESRMPTVRQAIEQGAEEADCAFWDTYALMGGKGSLRRWRDENKAAPDGLHLLPRGYAELGRWLLGDLLAAYPKAP